MPQITIIDTLQVNAIVWIRSLPEGELGPTRRILDDLAQLGPGGGLPVFEFAVGDRAELAVVLKDLAEQAAQGLRPILHFDAHGNAEGGLLLAPSGEWAPWSDLLEALRVINIQTGNNLVAVFALCFGLHLYKQVELAKAVPAYLFIAPAKAVSVGFLEDETCAFYKTLHQAGAFFPAFAATLAKAMTMMNCQGIFLEALAQYVKTSCQGKARRERLERMVTKVIERDGISQPTPQQLGEARKRIRKALEPGEGLIAHYAPTFLIGRAPGFTYTDVKRLVNSTGWRRSAAF
jgi:hypothetical protein